MPFTLSHPAAVIPLRRFGVFSALVIGSIMPDTIYFLPFFSEHDRFGHTLPGIFFYCLPAGMALLWIFHNFAKRPLIALFPQSQQPALKNVSPDFRFGPFSRFAVIVWSILLGALTHVLWDTFTHLDGYAFEHWAWFSQSVKLGNGSRLWMVEVLQLGCSAAGIAIIMWCYLRWLRRAEKNADATPGPRMSFMARAALFTVFAVSAVLPLAVRFLNDPDYWMHSRRRSLVGFGIVDGIQIVCVEVLLFCVLWHAMRSRTRQPGSRSSEA